MLHTSSLELIEISLTHSNCSYHLFSLLVLQYFEINILSHFKSNVLRNTTPHPLDHRNEGLVALEDIQLYCMDLALEGDDVEAAQAMRQTIEKRKIPYKELHRVLSKLDSQRTGFVDHKSFEKAFVKLCGGENSVSKENLSDIERFIDPEKEGKLDLNFTVGLAIVCGDVLRAESKLKNLFKIMRVRGVDYREAISKQAGECRTKFNLIWSIATLL